ncbi:hypothetical protein [Streptomyces sp. B6B3]|uniref:hypothetical protein n=1 Tax=Streptomyces sp. B6B3 TaxID=3153570 RepID=UPI00325D99D5
MNVRIDYQPAPPPEKGHRTRSSDRHDELLLTLLGVGTLLVLVALILLPYPEGRDPSTTPTDNAPSASPSPPAEEMPRGEATAAASLATRSVSGLPRGFPRTEPGAVEAGASFAASALVVQRMAAEDREAYVRDAMLEPPSAAELDAAAADFRAEHDLTATGQLLDPNGEVSTTTRFTSQCFPELGAYDVVAFRTEQAAVDYWMPCLLGVVEDGGEVLDLQTQWQMGRVALHWNAGDWRVGDRTSGPFDVPLTPPQAGEPATTLAERAALLGEGWEAFADASEERPPPLSEEVLR